MFGFFGLFGRSHEMKRLDQAVRDVGLHPNLVPDAVQLTTFNLLKAANGGSKPEVRDYHAAAEMLGYCMLGSQGFTEANGLALTEAIEARLEAALHAGDSLDARIILLALHAGVIQAQVIESYQLETA
jgi:hypothetical protein